MRWLSRVFGRLGGADGDVPRRELAIVLGLAAAALVVRLAFVLLTTDHVLVGDEGEYDTQGRFIADQGRWFWSTTPYGNPHESLWKAPGYPLFVGLVYKLLGSDPDIVFALQSLLGPITVVLTWALARRLFGPAVGLGAAAIVALHPFAWQFDVRLFAEPLVTPLGLAFFILVLERPATARRALVVGALVGLTVLIRPSALYLLPAVAVAWVVAAGWRRGIVLTGLTVLLTVLVVFPWTLRNHSVSGAWVPVSVQDAALYGVFNDDAANDSKYPWAWRYRTARDRDVFDPPRPIPDARLREILRDRAFDYIRENPSSVPKAFFWNGLSRLWDVRRPAHIMGEAGPTGRKRLPTAVGIALHYVLFPLCLLGLWFARRRLGVVLPLLAMGLAASVVFTADATTRYRAPFEPLIAILASFAAFELLRRWRGRSAQAEVQAPR